MTTLLAEDSAQEVPSAATTSHRYHALDALRGVMMTLGILTHVLQSYVPYLEDIFFVDATGSPVFFVVAVFLHTFRMPIFFVMAGFFSALLYHRRGAWAMARNRFDRIVVPFVLAWIVFIPLTHNSMRWGEIVSDRYTVTELKEDWQTGTIYETHFEDPTQSGEPEPYLLGYLWFLYYLAMYCASALVLVPLINLLGQGVGAAISQLTRQFLQSWWRVPVFGVIVGLTLLWTGPLLPAPLSFVPSPSAYLAFVIYFGLGWLVYRERNLLNQFNRHVWIQIGLAIPLFVGYLLLFGQMMEGMLAGESAFSKNPGQYTLTCLLSGLVTTLLTFGFTGLFLRHFGHPKPWLRYLSDASYWIYLGHMPLAVGMPILIRNLPIPGVAKVALATLSSFVILVATYHFFVRSTIIGRILNGRTCPFRLLPFGPGEKQ